MVLFGEARLPTSRCPSPAGAGLEQSGRLRKEFDRRRRPAKGRASGASESLGGRRPGEGQRGRAYCCQLAGTLAQPATAACVKVKWIPWPVAVRAQRVGHRLSLLVDAVCTDYSAVLMLRVDPLLQDVFLVGKHSRRRGNRLRRSLGREQGEASDKHRKGTHCCSARA